MSYLIQGETGDWEVIVGLEEEMLASAEDLRFEEAARLRDELKELRADLEAIRA